MIVDYQRLACVLLGVTPCLWCQDSFADNLLASWVDTPASPFARVEYYRDSAPPTVLNVSGITSEVAIAPSGELYVGFLLSTQIQSFSATGVPQGVFVTTGLPYGCFAFNAAGNLLVATTDVFTTLASSIEQYGSDGSPLGTFAIAAPGTHFDMAKNSNGEVYLTTTRSSIQHFDSDGTLLNEFAAGGKLLTSIALDSQSNVYVTVGNASVAAFTSSGTPLGTIVSGLGIIDAIAIDSNDVLYVGGGVEFESQGFIKKFSLSGAFLDDFVTGQPGIPNDFAFAFAVPEPGALTLWWVVVGCVLLAKRGGERR